MSNLIKLIANNGIEYQFMDEKIAFSSIVELYLSSDKKYILSLYRNIPIKQELGNAQIELVRNLIDEYSKLISQYAKNEYWRDFFNFPLAYVEWDGSWCNYSTSQ